MISEIFSNLRGYHFDDRGFKVLDKNSIGYRVNTFFSDLKDFFSFYSVRNFFQEYVYPFIAHLKADTSFFYRVTNTLPIEELTDEILALEQRLDIFIDHLDDPWDYRLPYNDLLFLFRLLTLRAEDKVNNEHVNRIFDKCMSGLFVKEQMKANTIKYIYNRFKDSLPQHVLGVISDYRLFIRMNSCCNEILLCPLEAPKPERIWEKQTFDDTKLLCRNNISREELPDFVRCLEQLVQCDGWRKELSQLRKKYDMYGWPRVYCKELSILSPTSLFQRLIDNDPNIPHFTKINNVESVVLLSKIIKKYGNLEKTLEACYKNQLSLNELRILKNNLKLGKFEKFSDDCFTATFQNQNDRIFIKLLQFAKSYEIPDLNEDSCSEYLNDFYHLIDNFDFLEDRQSQDKQVEYFKYVEKIIPYISLYNETFKNFQKIQPDSRYPQKLNTFIRNNQLNNFIELSTFQISKETLRELISILEIFSFNKVLDKVDVLISKINENKINEIEKDEKLSYLEYYILIHNRKLCIPFSKEQKDKIKSFLVKASKTQKDKTSKFVLGFHKVRNSFIDYFSLENIICMLVKYGHANFKFYEKDHSIHFGFDGLPYKNSKHVGKSLQLEEYKLRPYKFIENFDISQKKLFNQVFKEKLKAILDTPMEALISQTSEEVSIMDIILGKLPKLDVVELKDVQLEKNMICSQYVLINIIKALLATCEELKVPAPRDISALGFYPWVSPEQVTPRNLLETWLNMGALSPTDTKEPYTLETFVDC